MTGTTTRPPIPARRSELKATLTAIGVAAVPGIVSCLVIAAIAAAAGVPRDFEALWSSPALVIAGVTAGALGWNIVRQRSANPRRLLSRLVPAVLVLSFIPDIVVGATKALPHTTWGGVVALMLMHLAVAACAVASYGRFLPARGQAGPAEGASHGIRPRPAGA